MSLNLLEVAQNFGTPTYVYHLEDMEDRVKELKEAFQNKAEIHYAIKANDNCEILKLFLRLGLGVDTVSWGEIQECLDLGFKADQLIFSGVAKTKEEITGALKAQIKQINVESPQELNRIGEIAQTLGLKANVAFRMNPDVNPNTHPYITTGFRDNKFGMDTSFLPELKEILKKYPSLELKGLTLHIGSQLMDLHALQEGIQKTAEIYKEFQEEGYDLETFDIGGGVGISYDGKEAPNLKEYGSMVLELLEPLKCRILMEPGRVLVGPFGTLLTEVQYIKKSPYKNFAIVNTGMHHLMRPALYQAYHRIENISGSQSAKDFYDVVGPICESSDCLAKDRELKVAQQGDILAIYDTGAYGFTMSNFYNKHPLPKEVIYYKGDYRLTKP